MEWLIVYLVLAGTLIFYACAFEVGQRFGSWPARVIVYLFIGALWPLVAFGLLMGILRLAIDAWRLSRNLNQQP